MRVFLTGATGFIGSHVARQLLQDGHTIAALVSPHNPLDHIKDIADQLTILEGRLADLSKLHSTLTQFKPEACIHLAWYAEPGKYLQSPLNAALLSDSLSLLEAMIEIKCKQVVMVGTCAEYDTDMGYLREDNPTRPETIYAASKLSLNLVGQQMAARAGINFAWARLFYLYGPHEDERRLVAALIHALGQGEAFQATAGEQVRDYLHVEDVAGALIALATQSSNGIFNISSGLPLSIRHLMETIADLMQRPGLIQFGALPYREWDPMFICGDNRKLRELGWSPRYTLRNGLQHTIDWWACQ